MGARHCPVDGERAEKELYHNAKLYRRMLNSCVPAQRQAPVTCQLPF